MEEKYMVNDVLESNKAEIMILTDTLIHSENLELKQIIEQLRNGFEAFHSELFTLATSKGYYAPTTQAKPDEIENIKNLFI